MSTPTSSSVPTHDDTPRTAYLDMGDGTFAEAAFFGDPGRTRFGVTHIPEVSNGRGVVVCSPVYNDYLKNSRREVLLARRLARSGFTVQRFHYAGTGNSEGEILDMTLDSMITDTTAATDHLRARVDVDDVAFMGTRIGAIPAGSAAVVNAAPLAVWEPIEGTRYFRELFRTMLMIEMTSDGGGANLADLKARFEDTGIMDAAGYAVSWSFYESCDRSLPDVLNIGQAPIFIAQSREKEELTAEYVKLVDAWESGGRVVTKHHVLAEEAWMLFVYGFQAEEEQAHSSGLIDATAAWFEGLV